jgi:hypothetical protein
MLMIVFEQRQFGFFPSDAGLGAKLRPIELVDLNGLKV